MRIVIITNQMPPYHCGIGDHSLYLADALERLGYEVFILAGRGDSARNVLIVDAGWSNSSLKHVHQALEKLQPAHLILQFTPLTYANAHNHRGFDLTAFWQRCAARWDTSIIVHETYFRTWWYPKSWMNGLRERRLLKDMVAASRFAFTASQPLADEMKGWNRDAAIHQLPIGANFPVAETDSAVTRAELGLGPDELVLTLFGGGNTLKWMRRHVNAADALLHKYGIPARWLLLGGVPEQWFEFAQPAIVPGRLPAERISACLQVTDIFPLPHYAGLCAKRGTLMAAMQHSLPVIGTRTAMTDDFWNEVEGIRLVPRHARKCFADEVLALAMDESLRTRLGAANQEWYESHCSWPVIARQWLDTVDV